VDLSVTDLGNNIIKVALQGRLDAPGVDRIETRLTATIVPRGGNAIIDLSGVSFAGSLALRMFITIHRALARRAARLVLLSPQDLVNEVFSHAALGELIPIAFDERDAVALLE